MTRRNNSQDFEWDMLVPRLVHPLKVAIIEAMSWIDEPLSPRDLDLVFDDEFGVSLVAYHVGTLADYGVVEKVGSELVRGVVKTFYELTSREPADSPLHCE